MNCYQSPALNVEKSINNRIFPHVIACLRKKKKKNHLISQCLFSSSYLFSTKSFALDPARRKESPKTDQVNPINFTKDVPLNKNIVAWN